MPRKKKPSERQDVFEKLDEIEISRLPDGAKWEGFRAGDPRAIWKAEHGAEWENIKLMDLMFENVEAHKIDKKIRELKRIENAKATIEVRKGIKYERF